MPRGIPCNVELSYCPDICTKDTSYGAMYPIYYWRNNRCSLSVLFLAYEKSSWFRSKKEYSRFGYPHGEKNTRNPELQPGSAEQNVIFAKHQKCQKSKISKVLRFPPNFFRYLDLTHKNFKNIIRIWRTATWAEIFKENVFGDTEFFSRNRKS